MAKRHIRLRQLETKHRVAFWVCVSVSVGLVVAAWLSVMKDVLAPGFEQIQIQVDVGIEAAAEGLEKVGDKTAEYKDEYNGTVDVLKEIYESEQTKEDALGIITSEVKENLENESE